MRFLLAGLLCLVASCSSTRTNRASHTYDSLSTGDDIATLEHGLLPPVVIRGAALSPMRLEERMKHFHVPAVSVALLRQGHLAWARAWGSRDTETRAPATTRTRFLAGSISKPITALAVLELVARGAVKLDVDINRQLKAWRVPTNELTEKQAVTPRQLLSHSAGTTVHGFGGYADSEAVPTLLQVLDGVPPAQSPPVRVDILPGSQFRYSGGGYCILQQLVIDTTGKPFATAMRELVLAPLEMKDSTFAQPRLEPWEGERAAGYDDQEQLPSDKSKWPTQPEMAAAGLWTTPSDLAQAVAELIRARHGDGLVLPRELALEMLRPGLGNWGLGWQIENADGTTRFEHGGSDSGFEAAIEATIDGDGFVVMTNSNGGRGLLGEVSLALGRALGWPNRRPEERAVVELARTQLQSVAGRYKFADGRIGEVALEGRQLVWKLDGNHDLYAESPDDFFSLQPGAPRFHFVRVASGAVDHVVVKLIGIEFIGMPLPTHR